MNYQNVLLQNENKNRVYHRLSPLIAVRLNTPKFSLTGEVLLLKAFMVNPQLEDGYTPIANEILDALVSIRIPGEARQCLDFIIRKTYGFNKKEDWIALSQFVKSTGLRKPTVQRALKKLLIMNTIIKKDNGLGVTYGLQKDCDQWKPLPKKITVIIKDNKGLQKEYPRDSKKSTGGGLQKDNEGDSKKIIRGDSKKDTTKDYITKDNITKDIPFFEIIENLNKVISKNFKPTTEVYKAKIRARWKDGYRLDDFIYVNMVKAQEWLNDSDMKKHLNPETLYGNKFHKYRQQEPKLTNLSPKMEANAKACVEWVEKHRKKNERIRQNKIQ